MQDSVIPGYLPTSISADVTFGKGADRPRRLRLARRAPWSTQISTVKEVGGACGMHHRYRSCLCANQRVRTSTQEDGCRCSRHQTARRRDTTRCSAVNISATQRRALAAGKVAGSKDS